MVFFLHRAAGRAATFLATRTSRPTTASTPIAVTAACNAVREKVASTAYARFFSLTVRLRNAEDIERRSFDRAEWDNSSDGITVGQDVREAAYQPNQTGVGEVAELKPGQTPHCLFVRNMAFDVQEADINEQFAKYGEIESVVLVRDARGLSKGFAFIYFTTAEALSAAATEANGMFWHGRRLGASPRRWAENKRKTVRRKMQPTTSLYIGNIPYETTDAELNRLFRQLDNITDVRVAVDRTTGWPRGFAHADFADVASAQKAYEKLRGVLVASRELRVDYAEPRVASRGEGSRSLEPDSPDSQA